MKKIGALLLAAGQSQRAKTFKPLLPWEGQTFLAQTLSSLHGCFAPVLILMMTGHRAEELQAPGITSLHNPDYATGMMSSLQVGLKAVQGWDAALIALVDQPQLKASDYARIVEEYRHSDKSLLRPVFRGQYGNPAIIGRKYFAEIINHPPGDHGAAFLFAKYPADVATVEMPDAGCLTDFDREEELLDYAQRISGQI